MVREDQSPPPRPTKREQRLYYRRLRAALNRSLAAVDRKQAAGLIVSIELLRWKRFTVPEEGTATVEEVAKIIQDQGPDYFSSASEHEKHGTARDIGVAYIDTHLRTFDHPNWYRFMKRLWSWPFYTGLRHATRYIETGGLRTDPLPEDNMMVDPSFLNLTDILRWIIFDARRAHEHLLDNLINPTLSDDPESSDMGKPSDDAKFATVVAKLGNMAKLSGKAQLLDSQIFRRLHDEDKDEVKKGVRPEDLPLVMELRNEVGWGEGGEEKTD